MPDILVILHNKIKFHSTDIESLVSHVPHIYGVHVYILAKHPGLHLKDLLFFPWSIFSRVLGVLFFGFVCLFVCFFIDLLVEHF